MASEILTNGLFIPFLSCGDRCVHLDAIIVLFISELLLQVAAYASRDTRGF